MNGLQNTLKYVKSIVGGRHSEPSAAEHRASEAGYRQRGPLSSDALILESAALVF